MSLKDQIHILVVDDMSTSRGLIVQALEAMGIKNIHLGPSLPAFITPNVLKVLVDTYNIKPVTTPDADLKAILG